MIRAHAFLPGIGVLLFCLCGGCSSSKSLTVDRYARGDQPLIRKAPETAVYKVQWLSADELEKQACVASDRLVLRGEPLGFATGPDGHVTAIAGTERFTLDRLPSHARYCQWQFKLVKENPLRGDMPNLGEAANVIAGGLLLGGLLAVELGTAGLLDHLDSLNQGEHIGSDHHRGPDGEHDHARPHSPTSRPRN